MLPAPVSDQAQVSFVDEGSRFQRLPRLLLDQSLRRQLPQFVVDQWQKLRGGVWVALFDGRQNARDLAHACQYSGDSGTQSPDTSQVGAPLNRHIVVNETQLW
jgi:hypothetical protein